MQADGGPASRPASAGSKTSSTLTLHTARKREFGGLCHKNPAPPAVLLATDTRLTRTRTHAAGSKASLVSLSTGASILRGSSSSDSGLARSGSGSAGVTTSFLVLNPASSQQQQPATVTGAMSVDGRLVLPGGGGGGGINSSGHNSNNNGSGSGSRPPAWQIGGYSVDYALDWALVLVAVMVLAAIETSVPRNTYIPKIQLRDTSYPLYPNSVPAWSVPVIAIVLPAVLHALHCVVLRCACVGRAGQLAVALGAAVDGRCAVREHACSHHVCRAPACAYSRRPTLEGHHLVLGLLNAVIFTAVITNLIKCPVGRLRPDFNAR
jgi:hypothetical protein